jgi:5-methylcytosine-specific restriction endonuclease McrA
MDHVIPLVRGGRTLKTNVVPSCAECNAKKKYLLPMEWEEYLERIREA